MSPTFYLLLHGHPYPQSGCCCHFCHRARHHVPKPHPPVKANVHRTSRRSV